MSHIPQTHFSRVKLSLKSTLKKLRDEIEQTRAKGKITADYSLGFINGLIFVDHQMNARPGQPIFYNRTTSVGSLPKPTALRSGDLTKDTTTYQVLMDQVLLHSRAMMAAGNSGAGEDVVFAEMANLEKSIEELDKFSEGDRHGRDQLRNESGTDAKLQPSV